MFGDEFHWVMPPSTSDTLAGSPVADMIGTHVPSDVVSFAKYKTAYFMWFWGVGTAGTQTLTVIPCDDAVPSNTTTAIPFQYKIVSATDTNAAWVAASTVTTTAGSDQMYIVKVSADDLPLVSGVKYEYAYSYALAVDSTAILGGCIIMMADPRYAEDTTDSVIA
ncbi:MAG: hypothetical protein CMB80_02725 [Flammeovirgaceae bacterium]|nr:hypothetical protein [Flammeovirgaceae bacterium]